MVVGLTVTVALARATVPVAVRWPIATLTGSRWKRPSSERPLPLSLTCSLSLAPAATLA